MNKKIIFLGLACLLFAAATKAEIVLVEPTNQTIVEATVFVGEQYTQTITIWNAGKLPVQGITPTTDLNAQFQPTGFGLDVNKTKEITLIATPTETTQGTVQIGDQNFELKINILPKQGTMEILMQKWQQYRDFVFVGMFFVCFILIVFMLRKT